MNTLIFLQKANNNGTCDCILNGKRIDSCDMNNDAKYTQAHIVLASAIRTLKTDDIHIEVKSEKGAPAAYPVETIKGMAKYLINDSFEDIYGYTRVYSLN